MAIQIAEGIWQCLECRRSYTDKQESKCPHKDKMTTIQALLQEQQAVNFPKFDWTIRTRQQWKEYLIKYGWKYKSGGWWSKSVDGYARPFIGRLEAAAKFQHDEDHTAAILAYRAEHGFPETFDPYTEGWSFHKGIFGVAGV